MTSFIFDLDGTIIDTVPLIRISARQTAEQYGLPIDEDAILAGIGIPLVTIGETVLGPGRGEEYADAYTVNYFRNDHQVKSFPGMAELIEKLSERGAKLAIATSKRGGPAKQSLELLNLRRFFPVIIHSESGCGHKPGPEPAEQAMLELGSNPAASWFIGDSVHDIACGKSSGIKTIGVTWGVTPKEALLTAEPDHICDSIEQLGGLLLQLLDTAK
jgi:pyrophosphatase PpaX